MQFVRRKTIKSFELNPHIKWISNMNMIWNFSPGLVYHKYPQFIGRLHAQWRIINKNINIIIKIKGLQHSCNLIYNTKQIKMFNPSHALQGALLPWNSLVVAQHPWRSCGFHCILFWESTCKLRKLWNFQFSQHS